MIFSGRKFFDVAEQVLRLKRIKAVTTQKNASWQFARLKRNFGHLPIHKITEQTWADYIEREMQRRPRKFFDDRKYMRMALRLAKKKRYISEIIDLPIPDLPGTSARAPSLKEIFALERYATPTLRFQVQIAWRMGLRRGEILRLRWDQIDLKEQVIRLCGKDTKTRMPRTVPIPHILLAEFSRRMARAVCQWVFWNPSLTGPVTTNARAWRRAKKLAGVNCRFHDLRHACATQIVRRGGDANAGAKYLGNSPTVFTGRYVHPDESGLRRIARLMGK